MSSLVRLLGKCSIRSLNHLKTHHDASVCSQAKCSLRKWRKLTARNNDMTHDFTAEVCERVAAESRSHACLESEELQRTWWWISTCSSHPTWCDDRLAEPEQPSMMVDLRGNNLQRWSPSDGALNNGWLELPQTYHQILALVVISKPVNERWGGSLIPFSCILSSSLHGKAF